MKQKRFQLLLEQTQKKELENAAKKKGVSLAEHIRDILKASLSQNTRPKIKRKLVPYQMALPDWVRKELIIRAKTQGTTLARYVRELCNAAVQKERENKQKKKEKP